MNDPHAALSLDEVLRRVIEEPDPEVAQTYAHSARRKAGFFERWKRAEDLALPEELDPAQRRVAETFTRRTDLHFGGCGLPSSQRRLRQWLGLAPPSILDRRVRGEHQGEVVSWPLWRWWVEAADEELEHGQGVSARIVEATTPADLIAFAGEATLEHTRTGSLLEKRVMTALEAHAAEAAPWARGFAELLTSIVSPDGPYARPDAVGYQMHGIFDWNTLGLLALLPLVRAGEAIAPHLDRLVPSYGPRALVREILGALPPERREAAVHHRLSTDWGEGGERALNGFHEGLSVLDLAPSERVARIIVAKYRNNRKFFARAKEKILARLDALAASQPGVAAALKPHRAAKKKTAGRTTGRGRSG